jgi:hypothetical protein
MTSATGDRDDRLYRGVVQAQRAHGRAEAALDRALRALVADDAAAARTEMRAAELLLRSGADTLSFVLEHDELGRDGEP